MAARVINITEDGDYPIPVTPGVDHILGVSEVNSGDWASVTITLKWRGASADVDFEDGVFTADGGIRFAAPVEEVVLNVSGISSGEAFRANISKA